MREYLSQLFGNFALDNPSAWVSVALLAVLAAGLVAITKAKKGGSVIAAYAAACLVLLLCGIALLPWYLTTVLTIALAAGIILLVRDRTGKAAPVLFGSAAVIALLAALIVSLPNNTPDGTHAWYAFIYQPVFLTVLFGVMLLCMAGSIVAQKHFTVRQLCTIALCVALSFVLSCLTIYRMPQGGSITLGSMLPIMLLGYLYGPVVGCSAGVVLGILQLIQGAYIVHPVQFLMDYLLPFGAIGLCGLFRRNYWQWVLGIVVACLVRTGLHVLSGVIYFPEYAPVGQSVWWYSIGYNGSFMGVETAVCLLATVFPPMRSFINRQRAAVAPRASTASQA